MAKSPASTDGVIGLSSSKVALPAQLAEKGIIKNVLGHCLADGSNGGGYLFFGDELVPSWGMTWTPMMGKPEMYVFVTCINRIYTSALSVSATVQLSIYFSASIQVALCL